MPLSPADPTLNPDEQHALWSSELTQQYAWQFEGNTPIQVPLNCLPLMEELFKLLNETIKDSFDRSLFCWTELKLDASGLTAWYLGVEDYDATIEAFVASLSSRCLAASQ
ncbi:hypothetical protein [Alcaligenes sp. SDU_A2]|uniref:hypothetical protein n=1 Tax=Alcaligenes sp. SDU_A2 TaxID=3136634 RepID=UPI002C0F9324|nr:hypothetical protein [Alcaligenes sp.]HRL27872.1 hypothetical protein [Alcaligenes sp.]